MSQSCLKRILQCGFRSVRNRRLRRIGPPLSRAARRTERATDATAPPPPVQAGQAIPPVRAPACIDLLPRERLQDT